MNLQTANTILLLFLTAANLVFLFGRWTQKRETSDVDLVHRIEKCESFIETLRGQGPGSLHEARNRAQLVVTEMYKTLSDRIVDRDLFRATEARLDREDQRLDREVQNIWKVVNRRGGGDKISNDEA